MGEKELRVCSKSEHKILKSPLGDLSVLGAKLMRK